MQQSVQEVLNQSALQPVLESPPSDLAGIADKGDVKLSKLEFVSESKEKDTRCIEILQQKLLEQQDSNKGKLWYRGNNEKDGENSEEYSSSDEWSESRSLGDESSR